jgi:zinc transporter 1/2/3
MIDLSEIFNKSINPEPYARVADSSETTAAKAVAMSCLFLISMLCGILPFKLAQIFKWEDGDNKKEGKTTFTMSTLLSFGGGCLLATTFLHLLPEIGHEIRQLQSRKLLPTQIEHLAELLMCIGFFVIYFVEELVHFYLHRHQEQKLKRIRSDLSLQRVDPSNPQNLPPNLAHHLLHSNKDLELDADDLGIAFERGMHARSSLIINPVVRRNTLASVESLAKQIQPAGLISPTNGIAVIDIKENNHAGHSHSHMPKMPETEDEDFLVSSIRGLFIVLALSVHELFEGLAVGLESSTGDVYYMFAAVSAHKFVIAFCIGVELLVQKTKLWLAVVYIFVYSIVSPMGEFFIRDTRNFQAQYQKFKLHRNRNWNRPINGVNS